MVVPSHALFSGMTPQSTAQHFLDFKLWGLVKAGGKRPKGDYPRLHGAAKGSAFLPTIICRRPDFIL
jgi:hypothetical protein